MKKVLVIVGCLSSLVCASKKNVEVLVQPIYLFEEEKLESHYDLHRAKIKFKAHKKSEKIKEQIRLSFDFVEKDFEDGLKEASYKIEFKKLLGIKVGQFKVPFGYESALSSSKLSLVYRGEVSRYLRKELQIAGYQMGGAVFGNIKGLQYDVGFYNYKHSEKLHGARNYMQRIAALPIVHFEYNGNEYIQFWYSFSYPFVPKLHSDTLNVGKRYLFQNIGLKLDVPKHTTVLEVFMGADTSSNKDLFSLSKESVGVSHAFSLTQKTRVYKYKSWKFFYIHRFEYLNGLTYYPQYELYENRPFNFTWSSTLTMNTSRNMVLAFEINEKFDKEYQAINNKKIVFQVSRKMKF